LTKKGKEKLTRCVPQRKFDPDTIHGDICHIVFEDCGDIHLRIFTSYVVVQEVDLLTGWVSNNHQFPLDV